jgi:F-type H+-transporting ATPase subunit b
MKRLALFLLLVLVPVLMQAAPQEKRAEEIPGQTTEQPAEGEHAGMSVWKWANFALLAGILGWAVKKNAGPFFAARSLKIREAMLEAEDLRTQSEARVADVDRRLANLESEIAALRAEAGRETESETASLSRATAAEIAKIQAQSEQEIAGAGKAARLELKRYSAELAISLAEQKIRARLTPETQDALVNGFVRNLDRPTDSPRS